MTSIFRPLLRPFAHALAPVGFWLPLAMLGGSIFGNWWGNRSAGKRHEASIAANERIDQRRSEDWREYARLQREGEDAFNAQKRGALRALGGAGLAGLPAGFDLGALALPGGALQQRAGGGGQMIAQTPSNLGGGGGGMADILPYLMMMMENTTPSGSGSTVHTAPFIPGSYDPRTAGFLPQPVPMGGGFA